MKSNLYFIENADGRQFAIKLLEKGDPYGLRSCLVWTDFEHGVEFYDVMYAGSGFDEVGQFVARYFVSTVLEHEGGLSLCGDIPEWHIDDCNVQKIQKWISEKGIIKPERTC